MSHQYSGRIYWRPLLKPRSHVLLTHEAVWLEENLVANGWALFDAGEKPSRSEDGPTRAVSDASGDGPEAISRGSTNPVARVRLIATNVSV